MKDLQKRVFGKKALVFAIILIIGIIALNVRVSAQDVCCEKTLNGAWCQFDDQTNCDTNGWSIAPTSCESTTFCQKGTCVDEQAGTCSSNTPKGACTNQGGTWYDKDMDEIPSCKIGCCIAGEDVSLTNSVECQQIASDYGVNVDFREDITDLGSCLALGTGVEKGACVLDNSVSGDSSGNWFSNLFGGNSEDNATASNNCKITTSSECASEGGSFNKGMLCSAPGLSNCAKSKKTTCKNEKVYFLDTCGNLANVYDEDMYSNSDSGWNQAMEDYWTYIKDPVCTVQDGSRETCGDCNYGTGTVCAEYHSGDEGMPNAPKFGNHVCRDIGCYYKDKYYHHGESWCAETPGTYPHVPIVMDPETKDKLRNASKYNLPGSRYVKLKCYDGEVITEECKDYRNGICKESKDSETGFTRAECVGNAALTCFEIGAKIDCEKIDDCKWIPGYRRDGKLIKDLKKVDEEQGSCMPLFAPGVEFWTEEGQNYCSAGDVAESPMYEVDLLRSRKKFKDMDFIDKAHKCFDGGCYAIPEYGDGFTRETLEKFQLGNGEISGGIGDNKVSRREGYYCIKDIDGNNSIDNLKTGAEVGKDIDCSAGLSTTGKHSSADYDRRRPKAYYTNKGWLLGIRDRARSLGDCGYKPHAFSDITNYFGNADDEIIKVTFQKLSQKGDVKENVTENEIIYKGNDMTPQDYTNEN